MQWQYVWSSVYVGALVEQDAGSSRWYADQDANWNVTAMLNSNGSVADRFVYDPYGKGTMYDANWNLQGALGGGVGDSWRYFFQGGRFDGITGLYNFRNRDLSPTLGRWMQQDAVAYAGGQDDLYGFLGDNPVVGTDFYGLVGADSVSQAIAKCLALPTVFLRLECLMHIGIEVLNPGQRAELDQLIKLEKSIVQPVSRFCRQKLGQQISEYKNLLKTFQQHLQKYCQQPGKTAGECNRIERQLGEYRRVLECRGQQFGPNGEIIPK